MTDQPRIREFESAEAMFAYMEEEEARANATVHPQQRSIDRGEYVVRPTPEMLIFGYLYDSDDGRATTQDLFDRGYRTGIWNSEACPQGEAGDAHVVTLWRIFREEYQQAMDAAWETAVIIRTEWGRKMFARILEEQRQHNATGLVEDSR